MSPAVIAALAASPNLLAAAFENLSIEVDKAASRYEIEMIEQRKDAIFRMLMTTPAATKMDALTQIEMAAEFLEEHGVGFTRVLATGLRNASYWLGALPNEAGIQQ